MYFSCLIPRSCKIWVFGAWLGQEFTDNSKYLFIEANLEKNIRPVWITKNPDVVKQINQLGYEAYLSSSIKGIYCQLHAKYAVMSNGISDFNHMFLGRAIFVNLWHGVPLKRIGYDNKKEKNWASVGQKFRRKIQKIPLGKEYVVATSEIFAKIYVSAFDRPKEFIMIEGQPRNDLFYDIKGIFDPDTELTEILNEKKVILYAPTHRLEGAKEIIIDELFDLKTINDFCLTNDYYFLIKKHFYHKSEWLELEQYSNIIDITQKVIDTQQLLFYTSILITDYSSIFIDYLLLDRPIIFYNFDYKEYLCTDRDMYFSYQNITPGLKVDNFKELMIELNSVSHGKDRCKKERERVRNICYCKSAQGFIGQNLIKNIKNIK